MSTPLNALDRMELALDRATEELARGTSSHHLTALIQARITQLQDQILKYKREHPILIEEIRRT